LISDSHQIESLIQQFPFLQLADRRFRDNFFQYAIPSRVAIGSPICDQGMQCQHLALITSGVARVYKLGENGREITLYRIGPGESCILTASCIVSGSPFPAFALCEEKIDALVINATTVRQWTDEHPVWRNYLFSLISDRLGDVISVIEEIAFRRVDRRLADYLLLRGDGDKLSHIKITHQAIASDLGTSREVVSRILKDFEHQGLISVSRGQLQITDSAGLSNKTQEAD
jgi:CRP/FNR family transcriptional regulator, anaerobic regulatory protein